MYKSVWLSGIYRTLVGWTADVCYWPQLDMGVVPPSRPLLEAKRACAASFEGAPDSCCGNVHAFQSSTVPLIDCEAEHRLRRLKEPTELARHLEQHVGVASR